MSTVLALLTAVRSLPWQAWAVAALALGIGLYGCDQRRQGEAAVRLEFEHQQKEAANAAQREVDRLRGGADRSRVRQFDRD
ncbi:hypothetical protein [Bosea sp. Root381]|uniref:hypothetical protein n=1 Tax=Bosea sp. Root381 TaxID=1736524 RepID=UPI0012E3ACC5|nr:hypothetical protein [Bosea sp. Root381]